MAALRQVPYLLWVIFAALLNASVWWMKKQKRTNVHFSLQYNFQCAILVSRVVNDLSIGNESYDLFPMLLYQFIQTEVDK